MSSPAARTGARCQTLGKSLALPSRCQPPVQTRLAQLLLTALLATLAATAPARAGWSSDPAANLIVADGSGEQVQAKLVPRADGGCYLSWFSNNATGYDVRLQRLSANGDELWGHNGVLVADRSYSSTQDYGLAVDAAGNALLAFRDDSAGPDRIVAAKIDPDGTPLWGNPGIEVSGSMGFLAAPKIAGTDDEGDVVVAWIQDSDTVLQRLDAAGAEQWAHGGLALAHSGDTFALADLHAAAGGSVIVSWVRYVTFLGDKQLWAQKLDAAGAPLWGAGHVRVFDLAGGSLQFGNFPPFVPDGSGGALFAWYTSAPALQVRAQRLASNGAELFLHNGVEVSTDGTHLRVAPAAAFDATSGTTSVFWVELNTLQSQFGLYGQRLNGTGAPLWGATGRALVPIGATELTQVRALPTDDGAMVAWAETLGFDDQPIHAARVDAAGDFVWTPSIVDVKSSATSTSRLAAIVGVHGFAILAWTDGDGARDLKAQDLGLDATLGPITVFADAFESGDTGAWTLTAPPP